jgi:two-component system, sensor histidine kinase RegB
MESVSVQETANKKNLVLLVTLRWLAVGGQIVTIIVVQGWLGIKLPLLQMGCVILFLVALNLVSVLRCRSDAVITTAEIFFELLLDVAALTAQLYVTGGATNPFISLFLLQVVLGAVLLPPRATWSLVVLTSGCFLWLTGSYQEAGMAGDPQGDSWMPAFFQLHIYGTFACFLITVVLLALFVTRINNNLREQDYRLSVLRQQSAEEEHIVRMGLLASGAAHELGSPLATLSVILNDWQHMPALSDDVATLSEIDEMQAALARCKQIVSQILLAAGEARGEQAERTTLIDFLDDVIADWRGTRRPAFLDYVSDISDDTEIVSDTVIRQTLFNVLDNALEASPDWVGIGVSRRDDLLVVTVRDKGEGFMPHILASLGKPYQSTKPTAGSGLGLFLVVNVLRKLGGTVVARNNCDGGASVELCLPIGALCIDGESQNAIG